MTPCIYPCDENHAATSRMAQKHVYMKKYAGTCRVPVRFVADKKQTLGTCTRSAGAGKAVHVLYWAPSYASSMEEVHLILVSMLCLIETQVESHRGFVLKPPTSCRMHHGNPRRCSRANCFIELRST